MTTEADHRKCFSCGFETTSVMRRCPECNRGLRTSRQVRVTGMVLVVIGAGLSAGMAYLIWVIALIMRNRVGGAASSFTGTPRDAAFIFALLGLVFVIGVTSLITGLWQVVFGRPNRMLSATALVLGIVTMLLAVLYGLQG